MRMSHILKMLEKYGKGKFELVHGQIRTKDKCGDLELCPLAFDLKRRGRKDCSNCSFTEMDNVYGSDEKDILIEAADRKCEHLDDKHKKVRQRLLKALGLKEKKNGAARTV
jgi:hypothetical protein